MPFPFSKRRGEPRPKKVVKRRKYTPPQPAKECNIVETNGRSSIHFFSVKAAKRALAGLIQMLPKRASKDEPKRFTIKK